jgi:flavin-dependent dehydrogenase
MNEWDAIVIGGGPAGAGFAFAAASGNKHVLLLEKHDVPAEKVCGGVLSPRCLRAIRRIGFEAALKPLATQELHYVEIESIFSPPVRIPFPPDGPLCMVVNRRELDAALWNAARAAGADVRSRTGARRIRRSNGKWVVETQGSQSWHAATLVGADGRNSFVARQLGLFPRIANARSVCYQFCLSRHQFDRFGCHFFVFERGYCGLSVDGNGEGHLDVLSLKGGETRTELMERLMNQRSSFVDKLSTAEFVSDRPAGRSPVGTGRRAIPAQPNVALLGDAQFWVEPFTGEGITLALESALIAADSFCAGSGVSCWRPTPSRTNHIVTVALEKPWVARALIRLLRMSPSVARWMASDVLS